MMKYCEIQPLRLRHPLRLREPAAGFASRLAAVNGRPMNVLLRDMLIPPRGIDKGEADHVRTLAAVGGADPEQLLRYTPYPAARDRFHVVAGETLGHLAINRTYFRFCPCCVQEDLEEFGGPISGRPWLRLQWTISHFRSCERHGLYLTVTAPLRRRFEPFDFAETMERYLDDLEQLTIQSKAAPNSPFQDWLLGRLDGRRDHDLWLNHFPLYVAAEWCEALGVSALHSPKVRISTLTASMWAEAANEGFRIASKGEAAILKLLGKLNDAQKETRGFWGLRDTYGYAYGLLQRTVQDPELESIRDMVRTFANTTIPIEPGTNVLGVVIDKPGVLTVRTAARASGAHDRTIRRMIERQGLAQDAIESELRNHRVTVSSEALDQVITKLKGALTAPQVMKELDIPRLHLQALITIGALPTATGSEKQANAKHRFARADVQDMLERILAGSETVSAPTQRQMNIMDARHAAGTSLENLLSMIFAGKLAWKGKLTGKEGYNAVLVDADEVTALVRSEPPMINLRRQDIPDLIPGMSTKAIDPFVKEELLVEGIEFSPEARREVPVITWESAELFRTNFVTLGELCQVSGLHHKQVRLLLKGVGIETEYDPGQFVIWVYDRATVDAVLAERPNFWRYNKAKARAAVS